MADSVDAPKALLIDLDNCPKQLSELSKTIDHFERIVVCYGGCEPKVHLDLVVLLASAIHKKQLEIIRMKKGGKNAADFGLSFWAGRLSASMPEDTEYIILSEDKDLDHVVNLLHSLDRRAVRINGKTNHVTSNGFLINNSPEENPLDKVVNEISLKLISMEKARPKKADTLKNSIKSWINGYPNVIADRVFDQLLTSGVISANQSGTIKYHSAESWHEVDYSDDIPF